MQATVTIEDPQTGECWEGDEVLSVSDIKSHGDYAVTDDAIYVGAASFSEELVIIRIGFDE